MDWADEIAEQIFHEFEASDMLIDPIATALRKAKADGRLEAFAELGLRPGMTVTFGPTADERAAAQHTEGTK